MKLAIFYNRGALQDSMVVAFADKRHFRVDGVSKRADLLPFIKGEGMIRPSHELVDALVRAGDVEPVELDPSYVIGVLLKIEGIEGTKLHKCYVGFGPGKKMVTIVCGATNLSAGKKVVVATPGTLMPDGKLIEKAIIADTESEGMICSARELGLPPEAEKTILTLDFNSKPGTEYFPI